MPKLATFDLLDKELSRDVLEFTSITDHYRWTNTAITFHVDPNYWTDYHKKISPYLPKLKWHELKYSEHHDLNKVIKTKDIGIYLFVVRPEFQIYSKPEFVMYVGISGEGGSMRPLRVRLNDYFNISNIKKRKKLHSMLQKYYHNTWIIYSLIEHISAPELEQLEEDFHGFFLPPFAERDFPVLIKNIIKAQFTR
jgi:hypothetical protein